MIINTNKQTKMTETCFDFLFLVDYVKSLFHSVIEQDRKTLITREKKKCCMKSCRCMLLTPWILLVVLFCIIHEGLSNKGLLKVYLTNPALSLDLSSNSCAAC